MIGYLLLGILSIAFGIWSVIDVIKNPVSEERDYIKGNQKGLIAGFGAIALGCILILKAFSD